MSPSVTFRLDSSHFPLLCIFCSYSRFHLIQNWSARYCTRLQRRRAYKSVGTKMPGGGPAGCVFIVSSMEGGSGCGSSTSVGTKAMGRALTIVVTSIIRELVGGFRAQYARCCSYLALPCYPKVRGVWRIEKLFASLIMEVPLHFKPIYLSQRVIQPPLLFRRS